jgi:Ankyrin repeats (3 copies)
MNQDQLIVIDSYRDVDEAIRALAVFDSQSPLSSLAAGLTQGLHGSVSTFDVATVLRAGAPINGLRRIDYGDGRDHWETALLTTLIDGHNEAARALILHRANVDAPCVVSTPGTGGFAHTALHMTVSQEMLEATSLLLDAGADANRQTTLGTTPLFLAASDDNVDMVRLLMHHQADPGIADFAGRFPRDVAGERTRHLLE